MVKHDNVGQPRLADVGNYGNYKQKGGNTPCPTPITCNSKGLEAEPITRKSKHLEKSIVRHNDTWSDMEVFMGKHVDPGKYFSRSEYHECGSKEGPEDVGIQMVTSSMARMLRR